MVMSSTDPVRAGIIASNEDSGCGLRLLTVTDLVERQIQIFYKIVGFKKLGIAYENSVLGKSYAAIDIIEKIAKEKGFDIVRCFTKDDIPDQGQAGESVVKCFEELAPKVDAIYVVMQNGVNDNTLPKTGLHRQQVSYSNLFPTGFGRGEQGYITKHFP